MKKILMLLFSLFALATWVMGEPPARVIQTAHAINLSIKGIPDGEAARFNGTYPISESGMLVLPKLENPIQAAGLITSQLARKIEAAYREAQVYQDPAVTVKLPDEAKPVVVVGGQVRGAGLVKWLKGMTVEKAGGRTEFTSPNRVSLIRDGKARLLDLTAEEDQNVPLKANDTIEVLQKHIVIR